MLSNNLRQEPSYGNQHIAATAGCNTLPPTQHMKNHITNKDGAIELIGDPDIYREVAQVFAKHLPAYTEQLRTALQAEDLPTIRRVVHSIKSNCATIGAEELRNTFRQIEQQATDNCMAEVCKSLPQALEHLAELEQNITEI